MNDLLRAARDVAIAMGLVAIAALLHMRFGTHLGGPLPMSVCYLAVIAAAALGGWRGGLAAVLAIVAMIRWVPISGLHAAPIGLAFFVVISLLLVALIAHARSQRHVAQMRQTLSERKLRAVFETDMWGICFTDLEGSHWLGNRAFRRMLLGVDNDGALGWNRLPEGSGGTGIRDSLERRGLFGPREIELTRPDGSRIWLLLTAVALSRRGEVALLALDISERKRIDEVLRTQRVLLRTIIDSVPAFIAYVDEERRYRLHNRYFEHWHPDRDIHGAPLEAVLEPELLERLRPHLDRAFEGHPVRFQVCGDATGRARHFDVHFIPHRPHGKVEGVVVHAHDVTERFEAAERIAASEQRLRALTRASAAIVWHADRHGDMVEAPGWEVLTGQTPEEYRGHGWMQAVHPDDFERVRAGWQRAIGSGQPADLEYRVCTADGVARYIAVRAVPVPGPDGRVSEWIGTVRDVHERRMVERQLRQAEADQRSLLENLPQMLWIADPDGRIRYHNRLWYEYTGLQPGDGWERVTHPDDLERAREAWAQALQHGQPLDVELRFRRADGAYRWHMICGVPIYEERPNGIGGPRRYLAHWYGASVDIEEQKRALETLATANQRVSQFLAVLSHELRNPLSGVTTACELLARGDVEPERRERALATMTRQSRHLQRIVDDLLDISRVTQGKVELRREPIDLGELLREVRSDNQSKAEREGVTIEEVEITGRRDGCGCYVDGDRSRLRQVFENLVSNAIKASSRGQGIHLRVHCDEERVRVEVVDEGQGIAPDVRASLFDPFVQTPSWRARGLGLGLDIVRKITELHHGTVSVFSEGVGRGTCFTVRLPRIAAPADVGALPPALRGSGAPVRHGREVREGARVLIVDDELENAEALQTLLEVEGLDVRVAGNADEALAIWRQWPCQVVLCDLELPGALSGYDVARALHQQPNPPHLIAYSGYGQAADRARTHDAGFQAHLIKPAMLDEILHAIEEGLRQAQAS